MNEFQATRVLYAQLTRVKEGGKTMKLSIDNDLFEIKIAHFSE
jgi:hypothetical protein